MQTSVSYYGKHPGEQECSACPLCTHESDFFHEDARRRYFRCAQCRLVFADRLSLPTKSEEKCHYDHHQNDPSDPRYRQFLSRMFLPLQERLIPGSQGLDFGCGPGPALSQMFIEAGHPTRTYDPIYAADPSALQARYGFITATEVAEHFHFPGREFDRLWSLLKPGGWLGIMTKRVTDLQSFQSWHYKLDPTHVAFFAVETFAWLAGRWKAEWIIAGDDVVLFRRQGQV